jgi:hypothetical protein
VGSTPTRDTAPVGRRPPPGTVVSTRNCEADPTHSSPSHAPNDGASSQLGADFSHAASSGAGDSSAFAIAPAIAR